MIEEKTDRRVARTRVALNEALVALMCEKNFDAITVADILARANVGRSTFYAHYTDKHDILRSSIGNLRHALDAMRGKKAPGAPLFGYSLWFFAHCHSMRALYVKQANCIVMQWFKDVLAEVVREELRAQPAPRKREVALEAVVQFVVGAFMAVLTWAFNEPHSCPPQAMDATFRALVTPGIDAAFGKARH